VLLPRQRLKLARGAKDEEHAMSQQNARVTVVGIDIGKNSFHIVGQDGRGEIVLRQKWSAARLRPGSPLPAAWSQQRSALYYSK